MKRTGHVHGVNAAHLTEQPAFHVISKTHL